jgi:hypothetical protein
MSRFVVAGRKTDDLALMLVRAFFSLKNDAATQHDHVQFQEHRAYFASRQMSIRN